MGSTGGGCARYDVSLVELIARPERYGGKPVRVIGFAHFEFEGDGLYLHREDYERAIAKNGLWLEPKQGAVGPATLSDRYVIVEGTFDARNTGHMGLWSGAVTHVTRLDPWEFVGKPGEVPATPP